MRNLLLAILLLAPSVGHGQDFTGRWSIDLRNPDDIKNKVDCGTATFDLKQASDRVVGQHFFATRRCGRLNDGPDESVKGVIVSPGKAVLVVTSGRNGAIAFGVATLLPNGDMRWDISDYVTGEPGDSLILEHGLLKPEK